MGNKQVQSDKQIAAAITQAIHADQPEISGRVEIEVRRGQVTLKGSVGWQHQRDRAEATARLERGVVTVDNQLLVTPYAEADEIRKRIEAAFARSAEQDATHIAVQVEQGKAVLTGRVRTWTEWTDAQTAAQSTPGVTQVQNELVVGTR